MTRDPFFSMSRVFLLCIAGVLADALLKEASARPRPFLTVHFALGAALYAATAFGWVPVFARLKLAAVGALYCVGIVLLLTAVGVLWFGEKLEPREAVGIVLAVCSIILLVRFS